MLIAKELRVMDRILLEEFSTTSSNTKYKTYFPQQKDTSGTLPHASSASQTICTSKFTMEWMYQDLISFFSQPMSGGFSFSLKFTHFILFRYPFFSQ